MRITMYILFYEKRYTQSYGVIDVTNNTYHFCCESLADALNQEFCPIPGSSGMIQRIVEAFPATACDDIYYAVELPHYPMSLEDFTELYPEYLL